jgi:polar amino acid transport system ATP-binding protein
MIECVGVFKRLGGRTVLGGVDLSVKKGEVVVLCGPSGTGKTTFLRALSGLEPIDSGVIRIDGASLPRAPNARALIGKVGVLFQHFNLFEHLNAIENICLAPRHVLGKSKSDAQCLALSLLTEFGLEDKVHHLPSQLSGGEKQRVALARCLAMQPSVMLMDEPTSALDPSRASQIAELIKRLKRDNMTTVIVTHDQQFAYQAADRMMQLDSGKLSDLAWDISCCELAEPNADPHPADSRRAFSQPPRAFVTSGSPVPVPA